MVPVEQGAAGEAWPHLDHQVQRRMFLKGCEHIIDPVPPPVRLTYFQQCRIFACWLHLSQRLQMRVIGHVRARSRFCSDLRSQEDRKYGCFPSTIL